MDVLYPKCCGLDVHKSSISACIFGTCSRASAEASTPFWRDDPRPAGPRKLVQAVRGDASSDGVQRCLLETDGRTWRNVTLFARNHGQYRASNVGLAIPVLGLRRI